MCWFSVFDYPVTSFEVWKWLLEPDRAYELAQVVRVLENSVWLRERIQNTRGFYLVKDNPSPNSCVADRREKFLDATRKFTKLRRASIYFSMLPGVRSVSAVNTLAWWHTSRTSDIDLFIVTKPGFIWSSRFFLVFPFALMGRRPDHNASTSTSTDDPFCFSFFVTKTHLQMESLKCTQKDYYLAFWSKSIVPMFDKDENVDAFEQVNKWASVILPNARIRSQHHTHRAMRPFGLPIQLGFLEPIFRSVQQKRLPAHLVELANKDTRVVVSDDILKFHENDRRELFMKRYQETVNRYL